MRILLVQTSFLGDTILSTPVIAGICRLHPGCELWALTTSESAALLKRDPLLAGILTFDKHASERGINGLISKAAQIRSMKFSAAYVLHRSFRSALLMLLSRIPLRVGFNDSSIRLAYNRRISRPKRVHDALRNLSILSSHPDFAELKDDLRLFAPERSELSPEAQHALGTGRPLAVLVPGSAWETKMWHWSGYRETAQALCARGMQVVITGSGREAENNSKVSRDLPVVDLTGRIGIPDLLGLIKNAALVICNDSMALHVASAFHTPTVAVFCATSPAFGFGPWKNRAVIVERNDLPCRPCSRHGTRQCPLGHSKCSTEISAAMVLAAAGKLLEETAPGL